MELKCEQNDFLYPTGPDSDNISCTSGSSIYIGFRTVMVIRSDSERGLSFDITSTASNY